MLDFLGEAGNVPFIVALAVMLLIGIVEALGLGLHAAHVDADMDVDVDGFDPLGWLGVGVVPLLMLIVVLLAWFGLVGLAVQQLVASTTGAMLPAWLASIVALGASLPLTGVSARGLARIMPSDETTAVPLDSLVGKRGTITVGTARRGSPAQARIRDYYGQAHYVMVEPHGDDVSIGEGETVLLVRREGHIFIALSESDGLTPHITLNS